MAVLNTAKRNELSDSDFALPGRRYPIHDEAHARNALARVSANGTPDEKMKVAARVRMRYPHIDVNGVK
jgi:hypothetical protein